MTDGRHNRNVFVQNLFDKVGHQKVGFGSLSIKSTTEYLTTFLSEIYIFVLFLYGMMIDL